MHLCITIFDCLQLQNSVRLLEVSGLAQDNYGNDVVLSILRTRPLDPKKTECTKPVFVRAGVFLPACPPAPPSQLPPDGNEELHVAVGELLSQNERNSVYAVEVINRAALDYYIPPLVIKVAAELEGRNLAEEAGMYRHLESVQGVVTPR